MIDLDAQREFAESTVRKLRAAGHEAYFAGGCVRDLLAGRVPKDYDVATAALPDEVRELFGRRRTLAIGAAFGVITVLGPKSAGTVEVATFRQDLGYTDGRRPDEVAFCSAEEDARRRDFTMNGLFLDPLDQRVLDFVGGRDDLERRLVRAIGDPRERFTEDKLRMLRAVRFAAGFGFAIEEHTAAAIREMASEIVVVSAERIAAEMRRMLVEQGRAEAVRLLLETRLALQVFPEIVPQHAEQSDRLARSLTALPRLDGPSFPLALGVLLCGLTLPEGVEAVGRRWRLATKETERSRWLVAHHDRLAGATMQAWSHLQPLLTTEGIHDLLACAAAREDATPQEIAFCTEKLALPPEELSPPPLLTGDDLRRGGLVPGPRFASLLAELRAAQLDGVVHTTEEAWALVRASLGC
ncbi:MAG: CCA tRNA nucleotidyltransferase [Planctomycetota bacterium]